jgi:hypothetical protein
MARNKYLTGKVLKTSDLVKEQNYLGRKQPEIKEMRIPVKVGRHSAPKVGHLSGQSRPPVKMAGGVARG